MASFVGDPEVITLSDSEDDSIKETTTSSNTNYNTNVESEEQRFNLVNKDPIIRSAQEYLTVAQKLQREMGIFSLKDGVKCRAVVGVNGKAIEKKRRSKSLTTSKGSVAMWNGPPERSLSKKAVCAVPTIAADNVNNNGSAKLNALIHNFTEKAKLRAAVGIKEGEKNHVVELFHLCKRYADDKIDSDIIEKMISRVKKCDPLFTKSKAFQDFTSGIYQKIVDDPKNRHVFLKDFLDELNHGKAKKVTSKLEQPLCCDTVETLDSKYSCESSSTNHRRNHNPLNGHNSGCSSKMLSACDSNYNNAEPSTGKKTSMTADSIRDRQIQKLEKMLEKCSKRIRKYEETEMQLDELDEEESTYLLIEKYKKRAMQIWNKLCELTSSSPNTGRIVQKKFVYNGSRYPDINKQISRLINRGKCFPDYMDVFNLIKGVNEAKELRLAQQEVERIANECFKDVGLELKRRRIMDYEEHFGCPDYGADEFDKDPAISDEQLNAALKKNEDMCSKKRDDVFDEFLKKQEVLESQGLLSSLNDDHTLESDDKQSKEGAGSYSDEDEDSASDTESIAVINLEDDTESDETASDLDSKHASDCDDVSITRVEVDERQQCFKDLPHNDNDVELSFSSSTVRTTQNSSTFQEALDGGCSASLKSSPLKRKNECKSAEQQTDSKRRILQQNVSQCLQKNFTVNASSESDEDNDILIIN